MPLTVTDREVAFGPDNVPVVVTGKPLVVTAQPTQTPLIVIDSQGREQDQSGPRKAPVDGTAGTWSHTLPWPSETMNGPVLWQLRRLDGTLYQGVVPEGISGPVDVAYLQFPPLGPSGQPLFPAWQMIRAGQAPAQVVAVSPGVPGTPHWRGPYDPTATYVFGDAVQYGASSFVSKVTQQGTAPPPIAASSNTWDLAAGGQSTAADALLALVAVLVVDNDPVAPSLVFDGDGTLVLDL